MPHVLRTAALTASAILLLVGSPVSAQEGLIAPGKLIASRPTLPAAESKRYWSLTNYVPPKHRGPRAASVRNTLALTSSADLRKWQVNCKDLGVE
jgi:hypothetical protein